MILLFILLFGIQQHTIVSQTNETVDVKFIGDIADRGTYDYVSYGYVAYRLQRNIRIQTPEKYSNLNYTTLRLTKGFTYEILMITYYCKYDRVTNRCTNTIEVSKAYKLTI
jgi:hypothetical protein